MSFLIFIKILLSDNTPHLFFISFCLDNEKRNLRNLDNKMNNFVETLWKTISANPVFTSFT
ncbi:hypothetical protein BpHYR1_038322 [Brachionus plicatilis]|uniref:Uncharacterized protein n=1 Tax=Brachionus plicatilis TaxID=10195 RepID=A0A3M7Q2G4_BRAPC|nr:hypothetical protein BpHYR1_038322 [Brachionus plicatilis]